MARGSFRLLSGGTVAAGEHNEDAFGHHPHCLWVLDGATGVSARSTTEGPTDAAWLARVTAEAVARVAPHASDLAGLLAEVEHLVGVAYRRQPGAAAAAEIDMPTTCLGVARLEDDAVALAVVGDIAIACISPAGGLELIGDDSLAPFSERTMRALDEAMRSGGSREDIWERVRPVIHANRDAANRPDGYRVVHPARPWAEGTAVYRLPAIPGTRVLLASDGLWRLVDLFGAHAPHELAEAIHAHGLDAVFARLRAMEAEDADCTRYRRVKVSDDATGVLAQVVAG